MGIGLGCLGVILFTTILMTGISDTSSSGFVWFCIIGIGGSAFLGLYLDDKRKKDLNSVLMNRIKDIINSIEDFTISQEFVSPNMESYIAIDEENKNICIIENNFDNVTELSQTLSKYHFESYILSFEDILQTEILEDGVTTTKTSRGNQVGGALLGSVLAGGVGAVIGGLSGSQSSEEEVKKIQLQVIVNNTKKSFHRITFMSTESAIPKDMTIYKDANKNITHWHNLLSHLIKLADNESDNNILENQNGNSSSIADELNKFSQLLNNGYITQEEYNIEKEKLLNK